MKKGKAPSKGKEGAAGVGEDDEDEDDEEDEEDEEEEEDEASGRLREEASSLISSSCFSRSDERLLRKELRWLTEVEGKRPGKTELI